VLTSIHIEEHEIDARDTKLGAERSPGHPERLRRGARDLDERGIVRIGAEVRDATSCRKVTPKRDRLTRRSGCCADLRREGPRGA